MAERESGGSSSWAALIAGIFLVAIVAVSVIAYGGGADQRETAQLELNVPDVKINPPDIDLPDPPMPRLPPAVSNAPQTP